MKRINVKKLLLSALGLTLVAVLTVTGTLAYLQDESEEVINTFKANNITVTLTETTGKEYSIIPGTTVKKDPKVTVENTVDAWVFVEVTDKTQPVNGKKLVQYLIADGWTQLYDELNQDVYYREVKADADVKEFSVLLGDQVTYSHDLTNKDMLKTNGKDLRDNITLTFKATAIQQQGFAGAAEAWQGVPATAADRSDLVYALKQGKSEIVLNDNITMDTLTVPTVKEDTVIDLNNHALTAGGTKKALQVQQNATVTLKNGTITGKPSRNGSVVTVKDNANLILEDCKILLNKSYSKSTAAIDAQGAAQVTLKNTTIEVTASTSSSALSAQGASTVTAENCTIKMNGNTTFAVTTNGSVSQHSTIVVKNSTISAPTAAGKKGYALYAPTGNITFENCNVTGHIFISGGNVTLDGGTYTATGFNGQAKIWNKADTKSYVMGSSGGTAFNMGDSILIADRRAGYTLSSVEIKNITFNTEITLNDGTKATAYAIKYVDMDQNGVETPANIVIENVEFNNQIDGADPVMYIDKNGNDITFTPAP